MLVVASSAVAAQLLDGERTAHSAFEIPVPVHCERTRNIDVSSQIDEDLKRTSLIILDEIVFFHHHNLEEIDCTLRCDLRSILTFDGIAVLLIGDFPQLLPVVRPAHHSQIVATCFKKSRPLRCFKCLNLQQNLGLHALQNDPNDTPKELHFPSYHLNLRERKLEAKKKDSIRLPVYSNVH